MKNRSGFRKLVVDGEHYQYSISLRTRKCILYTSQDTKCEVKLPTIFGSYDFSQQWRGKHKNGSWSSVAVAELVREVTDNGCV